VLLPKRLAEHAATVETVSDQPLATPRPRCWGLYRRIEALPGIELRQTRGANDMLASDYYIDGSYVLRSIAADAQLLCRIDADGILLPMISPHAREEVLRKGWATGSDDAVIMYLPRDSIEMEIAWRIVLIAYQFRTLAPPRPRSSTSTQTAAPHGSSTSQYWM
jgi:hypothetical protein